MEQIFNELKQRISKIDTSNLILSSANSDGRVNSTLDEEIVFNFLHQFIPELECAPKSRYWYDCIYKGYPFNIKVTTGDSADNMSSKQGFMYALTGKTYSELPGYGNLNNFVPFNTALVQNVQPNNKDYGFIVFFKKSKTIFVSSLKKIEIAVPNGNNLPLQICWNNNIEFTKRSQIEQINYLMSIYIKAWHKKVAGLEPLDNWSELK